MSNLLGKISKDSNIVVLTGAGVSRESGIRTFRDCKDGLWEEYKIDDVATPEGWGKDKETVLKFYESRKAELKTVSPNSAHFDIAELEKFANVTVITQNVDDLHERGGSTKIIHMHGALNQAVEDFYFPNAEASPGYMQPFNHPEPITVDSVSENGIPLRPNVVWFGENIYGYESAIAAIKKADLLIIVGTSMQVYPVNSLHRSLPDDALIIQIDPDSECILASREPNQTVFVNRTATDGMRIILNKLKEYMES